MTADAAAEPDFESGDADDPDAELPGGGDDDALIQRGEEPRVPLSRLKTLGSKLGGQIQDLQRELADLKAQNAPEKVTRAQLEAEVEAGRLTRDEADAAWEKQLKADVAAEVKAEVQLESHQQTLSQQLLAYEEAVPELTDEGSETWNKVATELKHLMSIGMENTPATMLAACRSVLGPVGALKAIKKAPEPKSEGHQDGASGGGGQEQGTKSGRPQLTTRQKNYYRGLINKGILPDWDAAYAEVAAGEKARAEAGL